MSKYDVPMDIGENSSTGKIIRMMKPGSYVLEFGCAEGRMTQYMKEKMNCKVYVVEINEEAFQKAKEYAEDGICCDANMLEWKDAFDGIFFDYILFADVLENLQKPELVLNCAVSLLKNNGMVIASIPNIGHGDVICSLLCNRFHYTSVGLLDNTHIHFWGRTDFYEMAESTGLSVVKEDAVVEKVNSTEQAVFGRSLPDTMRKQIAQFPYSSIYQFVFAMQKKRWVEENYIERVSNIKFDGNIASDRIAKIYFDMGNGFSEEESKSYFLQSNGGFSERISVPKGCSRIRFDPIEGCYCVLRNLEVKSSEGRLHVQVVNGVQMNDLYLFQTTDPQIEIALPHPIHGIEITAEMMTFRGAMGFSLLNSTSDARQGQLSAELERNNLADRLTKTEAERDSLRDNLTQAEAERDSLRDNLTQAEAERDSLCDRMQQMTAQAEELKDQLINVSNSFESVSNSHIWKATKPIRTVLDKEKALRCKEKEYIELAKKTAVILRTQGVKAVLEKYKQRKIRLSSGYIQTQTLQSYMAGNNSFADRIGEEPEPLIPKEWINIQRNKPLISIIIAAKRQTERTPYLRKALESLHAQCYKNIEVVLVADAIDMPYVQEIMRSFAEQLTIRSVVLNNETQNRWAYWNEGVSVASGNLIGFLEQEDTLTPNCLAYVLEAYNESAVRNWELYLIPDEFQIKGDETHFRDWKSGAGVHCGGIDGLLHFGVLSKTRFQSNQTAFEQWLLSLKPEQIFVSPWIGCYGAAIEDVWKANQVRCIPFYLPQFHAIPENNKWWGEGFTEWVNVKGAKPLYKGHHQPRIPGELGYYDLSGEDGADIQKKQIALAKEYGLSGFCYYYYWFDGGKRLLEMPLDRHLHDKTMDFPFCLCWANENWTRQWDGQQNEILMPQTYQPGWAKDFILDLLPYLKDERYIRVNGAPFLLIYNLQDIPNPSKAINIWRTVARQNGIERLHISAVRRTLDASEIEMSGYTLDSLTDFPPHLLGLVNIDHDEFRRFHGQVKDYRKACAFHVEIPKQNYTYFRTAMLEWDNTARRGKKAVIFEEFSIIQYKKWLYTAKRYTLRQNRPGDDLMFINAWNEWAEGTYLEPSEPLGRAALEATKEVLERR